MGYGANLRTALYVPRPPLVIRMRFLLLPLMLLQLAAWAQAPRISERGQATTELAPGLHLHQPENGVWTLEHWEEGDLVRRDQWAAHHMDPTTLATDPTARQISLACLPQHPRCVRTTLFTHDMDRTSSTLRLSAGTEHAAILEGSLRSALQQHDLRTAETQASEVRNRGTSEQRP